MHPVVFSEVHGVPMNSAKCYVHVEGLSEVVFLATRNNKVRS